MLADFHTIGGAGVPFGLSLAFAVAGERFRSTRRRAALNEALHELRRPLQALSLAASGTRWTSAFRRHDPSSMCTQAVEYVNHFFDRPVCVI